MTNYYYSKTTFLTIKRIKEKNKIQLKDKIKFIKVIKILYIYAIFRRYDLMIKMRNKYI